MKENKFRAWDKALSYMHYGSEYIDMRLDKEGKLYHPDLIYMQYTLMKDKVGREIYEGDLVNGLCYNGSYYIGKVVYNGSGFIAVPIGKFSEGCADIDSPFIEVIGNIFENKELLEI